jgi:hypothetical protein
MKTTKMLVLIAGVAVTVCLAASPAFASKSPLNEKTLGEVSAKDNTYVFGDTASSTLFQSDTRGANILFGWYQWSDDHSGDLSDHKGANDQAGTNTAVQQNVTATVNSLAWGWISQNNLTNGGTVTLTGPELNMAYGVTAIGGF